MTRGFCQFNQWMWNQPPSLSSSSPPAGRVIILHCCSECSNRSAPCLPSYTNSLNSCVSPSLKLSRYNTILLSRLGTKSGAGGEKQLWAPHWGTEARYDGDGRADSKLHWSYLLQLILFHCLKMNKSGASLTTPKCMSHTFCCTGYDKMCQQVSCRYKYFRIFLMYRC